MAKKRGSVVIEARIPDKLQRVKRCGAEPGPRATWYGTDGWAPALQRIAPDDASHRRGRCAASGARERRGARAMTECEATARPPSITVILRLVRNRALGRGIEYAAAARFNHKRLGVLDRPVKPGDDSECVAADVRIHSRG
ncbi:hypothetical protein CVM73_16995 [Bradyrhizobium forestalis]|uniref:Uncharacterized protein n=1 Tax=Bradyrhizobium forestalis TaxID=1419263 RepID=A0A2M8R8F0_9BRAD|nr:hypothetical protein CVM73_16995 [Bradyrhizobium forestalis]